MVADGAVVKDKLEKAGFCGIKQSCSKIDSDTKEGFTYAGTVINDLDAIHSVVADTQRDPSQWNAFTLRLQDDCIDAGVEW